MSDDLNDGRLISTRNREEIIKLQIRYSQLLSQEEKQTTDLKTLKEENDFYIKKNTEFEADNARLNKEIASTIQKIDINYLLKEVDSEDLRLIAQNNKLMSGALHNLLGKWETIQKIEADKWKCHSSYS